MNPPCPRCGSAAPRERGAAPIVCSLCGGAELARAPHSRCAICKGDGRRDPGWETGGPLWADAVLPHLESSGHLARVPLTEAPERQERARLARAGAARRRDSEKAARQAGAVERERRAAELREQRKAARAEREEKERAAAQVDRDLLAGKDPRDVADSASGISEAQARARQLALARIREHRGRPWAEKAVDAEISRLLASGVPWAQVKRDLHVGSGRIRRVCAGSRRV